MSLTKDQQEKLGKARLLVTEIFPYLAPAIYSMLPRSKPGLGTFAVDKYWRLYVDPAAVDKWDVPAIAAVLEHEVGHLMREHDARYPVGINPKVWNICGDVEINDDIRKEDKLALPDGCVYPEDLGAVEGLSAEEYLRHLMQQAKNNPPPDGQGIPINLPGYGDGGEGKAGVTEGDCGSCAGGQPRAYEDVPSEGDGLDQAEADMIRRQVAEDISQRGDVPAGWARWADTILKPKVPWQKVIGNVVRSVMRQVAGMVDYSYQRRSRRRLPGIVLPGLYRPVPKVAVIGDTSGSMGDVSQAQILAEIEGIVRALGAEIEFLSVDAAVHGGVQRVQRARDAKLLGGGGTDMGVGIAAAAESKPDVIVVLTDGHTPWPSAAPSGIKVIVGIVGESVNDDAPEWAQKVRIEL